MLNNPILIPAGTPKWQPGQSYIGLIGTRCKSPTSLNGATMHMARSIHVARVSTNQIGAAFANWYASSSGEAAAGADATITASVEYPLGGNIYRLTFGGSNSGLARNFATLASDLITLPVTIPAGAQFAIREYRVCSAGGGVVYTFINGSAVVDTIDGECYVYGSSGITDQTGVAGTFTTPAGNPFSRPVAVFGPTNQPSYALLGDSRCEGAQDTGNGSLDVGELARSVGPLRAYTNLGVSGDTLATASSTYLQRGGIVNKYCTHVINEYGVNDIMASGQSVAGFMTIMRNFRNLFPSMWMYQTT